jgi:hypothetical protein
MKRMILSLTLVLGSTSLFANSHIGDKVVLEGMAYGSFPMKITEEITGVDSATGKHIVSSTTEVAGTTNVETSNDNDAWTHSNALMILAGCAEVNGVSEQLKLMGKPFMTCKVESTEDIVGSLYRRLNLTPERGSFVWIGDFPVLGAGKIESDIVTMEVTSLNWAE